MTDQAAGLRKMVNEKETKRTRIITIASGKGGVGKSNVTANLGLALEELGQEVLLLDGDIGMANLDLLLGVDSDLDLSHILRGEKELEEVIVQGPGGIDILPGISGEDDFVDISYNEIRRLLDASSHLEDMYDIILIDIGAGGNRSVINFINAADEALIVLTPEPTAIMDAYSLIKILSRHSYSKNVGLIINMVDSRQEGEEVHKRMKKVIKEYLQLNVELRGFVPFDSFVRRSVREQKAVLSLFPGSEAGQSFKEIARNVLQRKESTPSRGMKGFVYRIVGMFNRD